MSALTRIIRDELMGFAWDDFGLDDVECAPSTEWADDLAALIAQQVGRVAITQEMLDILADEVAAVPVSDRRTGARLLFEAAGFTVTESTETEVQPQGQATATTGSTTGGAA